MTSDGNGRDNTRGTVDSIMRERDPHDEAGKRGAEAWQRLKEEEENRKNLRDWLTIGEALQAGREWAINQSGSNGATGSAYNKKFGEFLKQYGLDDIDKGARSRLFKVMENLPEIEKWRRTLTLSERLKLNHPNAVWLRWQAKTRVPDPDKPKRPGLKESVAELSEENMHLKERLADRDAQLTAREAELEAARATEQPVQATLHEVTIQLVRLVQAAGSAEAESTVRFVAERLAGYGLHWKRHPLSPLRREPLVEQEAVQEAQPTLAELTDQWVARFQATDDEDETTEALDALGMAMEQKQQQAKERKAKERQQRKARGKKQPVQQGSRTAR
jgi:hypothetical protein